jgi:hypothetical protein
MSAIDQTQANKLLDASLGTTALTAFVAPAFVRLVTTASTSTTNGTELTGGSGYVTGGTTLSGNGFASSSAGATTGPITSALSWTNGSGGAWSIVGMEIWDSAATKLRWWFGLFTGQPISVAIGNTFQLATNSISVGLT